MTTPATVRIPVQLTLAGTRDATQCPAALWWTPADPWAVTLLFAEGAEWTFGWDILCDGITRPAGEGDVQLRPLPKTKTGLRRHEITLSTRTAQAVLHVSTDRLEAFANLVLRRWHAAVAVLPELVDLTSIPGWEAALAAEEKRRAAGGGTR